jgi:hypothetical protein
MLRIQHVSRERGCVMAIVKAIMAAKVMNGARAC